MTQDEDPNTIYLLVLSGGAFRGAVQYWVLFNLLLHFTYQTIYGVSVGSINGAMAAMHKMSALLDFYNEIDGKRIYLRLRIFWALGWLLGIVGLLKRFGVRIIGGLYSMGPLQKKLEEFMVLDDVKIPFVAGVVSGNTGKYYNLATLKMLHNSQFVEAILASACMAPIMQPPLLQLPGLKGKEIGFDGGFRNIFPIPHSEISAARAAGKRVIVHAIGCTPLDRIKRLSRKDVDGPIEMGLQGISIMEAEIFDNDLLQLQKAVGPDGKVLVWLPSIPVGDSFDATKETIQMRLTESKAMWKAGPITLPGRAA